MAARSASIAVFSALVVASATTQAQTGALAGVVYRDSLGHEIPGAEISIPALQRRVQANFLGAFRLLELPPGKHLLQVRALGFSPFSDSVVIASGKETMRDFILSATPTQLDSVKVVAQSAPRLISPALRAFEERRKQGFGHFITTDELRKMDGRALANVVMSRVPGVHTVNEGSATYLASGRNVASSTGPAFGASAVNPQGGSQTSRRLGQPTQGARTGIRVQGCWVTMYLDGVKIYDASMTERDSTYRPPDVGRMDTIDLGGIEYYAGGATLPPQFNATGSSCGTLLMWSRER